MITLLWDIGRIAFIVITIIIALMPKETKAQTPDTLLLKNSPTVNMLITKADSVSTLGKLVTALVVSNFIHVTSASANLDTGKVYSIEGAGMTTLNLPSYSTLGSSGITILGTGAGLYKIHPATGQQLVSPNGISKIDNDVIATNPLCAMVLRPNGNGQWKSTLTTGSYTYNTFKTLNAVGTTYTYPLTTIVNTSAETEIFRDTIFANTLPVSQDYQVEAHLNVSTPVVGAGTLIIKVYFGNTVVSVINGGSLNIGSLANAPIILYTDLVPKTNLAQVLTTNVMQPYPVLNMASTNSTLRQAIAEDVTVDKIFRITVTIGGTLSTNSIQTDFIKRNLF